MCSSVEEAVDGVQAGSTVMVGYVSHVIYSLAAITNMNSGFGLTGAPEDIIDHIARKADIRDLTVVSNDGGTETYGLCKLYANGQISKHYASYIGNGKPMEIAYLTGQTELHLIPQGTVC